MWVIAKPKPIPTSADACGEVTGHHAGCQDVGRCSTRVGSQGTYITFTSAKVNKAAPTLALKPREMSPEIQNRGTSGPKIGQMYMYAKNITKKSIYIKVIILNLRKKNVFKDEQTT